MRTQWMISLFVVLAVFAVPALADNGLLCTTSGHTCATDGTIVAQRDGDITGNIFYANADFADWVRVIDLNPQNPWTSSWMLDNQRGIGQPSVNFGHAMKNDILVVQICDQQLQPNLCVDNSKNQYLFASDPNFSVDGLSHAEIPQDGGFGPWGTTSHIRNSQLIWLEDLGTKQGSDWDYNDLVVSLHNVDVLFPNSGGTSESSPVPEPGTIVLLASGLAGGLIRRMNKN